jgi:hypothetical protein
VRPEGWEHQLYLHILEGKTTPFAWGTHDCVLWCADWVHKLTGNDYADDFRGKYATEEAAAEVLKALGVHSYSDLAGRFLEIVPVIRARRGDIMLHPQGMLGICDGAHAYFLTVDGVTRIAFDRCLQAWSV